MCVLLRGPTAEDVVAGPATPVIPPATDKLGSEDVVTALPFSAGKCAVPCSDPGVVVLPFTQAATSTPGL